MDLQHLFNVRGQGAIVTGGASGIGLAMVEALASQGAHVTILDMDAAGIDREVDRLAAQGLSVRGRVLDVTDRPAVDAAFDEAAAAHGLDIVFANAGIDPGPGFMAFSDRGQRLPEHAIEHYSDERWHRVVGVSLDAVFYAIRAAARLMKPQGRGGRIVVTTSISAVRPAPGVGMAYMAAKSGAAHLVRTAALELARDRIRVNAIAPGPFVTHIANGRMQDPAVQAAHAKLVPLGRMASTEEIKGLALFLASEASSFVTGEQVVIDGGASLGAVD
ncbi:SDR family NAD(P)-dependent oxidoreductase [Pseudacidovorax intermedius]|uniref:Short-chain dehydrogenase n=1 Tax=Pseudacidovorax intermedius TaxID=433924 RepID=A0A147GX59_9BURK|nr:SDR family NAD(P)-dependent oxidoreductase [Pseudacidovorax intermedius]KTT22274.1 short-chain dehydrogenase [Pseudacidovorax intermedius]